MLKNDIDVRRAQDAAQFASEVRGYHRRRTPRTSLQRATDIENAQARIRDAMGYLRPRIARGEDLSGASAVLQGERRRLWKMR